MTDEAMVKFHIKKAYLLAIVVVIVVLVASISSIKNSDIKIYAFIELTTYSACENR